MWGATLYHAADLPMRNIQKEMYNVFTPFRTKVEERCSVRNLLPTLEPNAVPLAQIDADFDATPTFEALPWASGPPELPPVDSRAALDFKGGETAALNRLQYYTWDSNCVWEYFETRNGMVGGDYSTKFSPWLALGCLSPRKVYDEVRASVHTTIPTAACSSKRKQSTSHTSLSLSLSLSLCLSVCLPVCLSPSLSLCSYLLLRASCHCREECFDQQKGASGHPGSSPLQPKQPQAHFHVRVNDLPRNCTLDLEAIH